MAYTWGYIKSACLAKLDLDNVANGGISESGEYEATGMDFLNRFHIYANEVITQVCSTVKPKYTFAKFEITPELVGIEQKMPEDFVSFGDDVNYQLIEIENDFTHDKRVIREELYDEDFVYQGYNTLIFAHPGTFFISYNARWFTFTAELDNYVEIDVPNDILDCIPSYVASQCYKIDDQYKSAVYRNEYEMFLARIDDTHYKTNKTIKIEGDW